MILAAEVLTLSGCGGSMPSSRTNPLEEAARSHRLPAWLEQARLMGRVPLHERWGCCPPPSRLHRSLPRIWETESAAAPYRTTLSMLSDGMFAFLVLTDCCPYLPVVAQARWPVDAAASARNPPEVMCHHHMQPLGRLSMDLDRWPSRSSAAAARGPQPSLTAEHLVVRCSGIAEMGGRDLAAALRSRLGMLDCEDADEPLLAAQTTFVGQGANGSGDCEKTEMHSQTLRAASPSSQLPSPGGSARGSALRLVSGPAGLHPLHLPPTENRGHGVSSFGIPIVFLPGIARCWQGAPPPRLEPLRKSSLRFASDLRCFPRREQAHCLPGQASPFRGTLKAPAQRPCSRPLELQGQQY